MKKLVIAETCLLYLMQIAFLVGIFAGLFQDVLIQENIITQVSFIVGLCLTAIIFVLCLVVIFISFLTNGENVKNNRKFFMIIKLVLIPYYLINFFIWFMVIVASLNPWLFLSVFITMPIAVGFTYIVMISTSTNNIVSLIRDYKNKQILTDRFCLLLVFHFIFCLDILGSILILKDKQAK